MAVGRADFERVIFGPRAPTSITKIQTDASASAGAFFVVIGSGMTGQICLSLKSILAIALVTAVVTALLMVTVDVMDWILRRIRRASRVAERRHPSDRGVPPEIVGSFERVLAFRLVLLVYDVWLRPF